MVDAPGEDPGPAPPGAPDEPPDVPPEPSNPRALIALIGDDRREPAPDVSDRDALANWAAASGLWHPALLARTDQLPRVEGLDEPPAPGRGDLIVMAPGLADRLPAGYRTQALDAGSVLLEGEPDRLSLARQALDRIEPGASLDVPEGEGGKVALDFLA